MRKIRGTAIAATGVAAVFALGACGSSKSSGSGATAATQDPNQKVTLKVWAMGAEGTKLGDVAKAFTAANPNITVEVTSIDWGVAHDKLTAAMTGGGPDVTQLGTTWMGEFAASGGLDEIPASVAKQSDYFAGSWATGQVNGKTYGVPWYVETRVLYYRTDLFTKAGITTPPATLADLQADAAKLKQGGSKYGIAVQPGKDGSWQQMLPFIWSSGGDLFGADGKIAADTDAFKKGLTAYQQLFATGVSAKTNDKGYDVTKDFATGDVPAFFSGPWTAGGLTKDHPELTGKWAIAPMPAGDAGGTGTSFTGGSDMVILKKSANKAAAQKFVAWLESPKTQVDFFKAASDLPANKAAWDDPSISSDPNTKIYSAQLDHAKSPNATPNWDEIAAKVDAWNEKLALGTATPDQAAAGIQSDATAALGS